MDNNKQIIYPYYDEHNSLLYSKVRKELPDNKKTYYWIREENGTQVKNLKGCRKILYRLPELLIGIASGFPIFLVEGEKDADTLLRNRLIATTTTGTLEWDDKFTELLKNSTVVILYDNDKTGLKRRDLLCKYLYGRVKLVLVIDLPGIQYSESHGKDISDWLEMGHTIEEFLKIAKNTPEYKAPAKITQLKTISIDELFSLELPEREMLLSPFLPSQGLVLLVARRGVGKTHIALGIAYAVATGGTFLCWSAPTAKRVLYVDGEMPLVLMQERLKIIESMSPLKPDSSCFQLITPDRQDQPIPDLSLKAGRDVFEEIINDYDLIILDNISCLFRSGNENDSDSWQEAQGWALDLRRRNKSILFVHHTNKNGGQRGTSKREDILDAVIILKQPDDYKSEEGARFDVIFDKSRHFTGEDAKSFQVQLVEEGEGKYKWILSDTPKDEEIKQIAEMKKQGLTIEEIKIKTKLTKAKVEWRLGKAKEQGLL